MTEYTEVQNISKTAPAELRSERLTFPEIMGGSSKGNLPDETILRAASIPYMISKRDAYPYPSVQISDNVFSNINNLPLKFSESDLRQEKLRGNKLQNDGLQPERPRPEVQRPEIQRQETLRAELQQTGDRVLPPVIRGTDFPSKAYEYNNLKNRSGDHRSPDAILYISKNFDPTKPVNLVVYNHGFGSTVKSAFKDNELGKQMSDSPPNTVLIVPEWQSSPGSRGYSQGNLAKPGAFRAMVEEVFEKTPELRGKTMRDVSKIHILSHSAGHAPTESQLYNNGISNKVASVTMIDSNYSPQKMEPWIKSNIRELANGSKRFISIFNDTTSQSMAQANRIEQMVRREGLPTSSILKDVNQARGNFVLDERSIAQHPIVFKYSSAKVAGAGAHNSMPKLYVGVIERASKRW